MNILKCYNTYGDEILKEKLSAVISLFTCVYTVWYMHFGTAYKNSGALSKIGLEHRILFAIWGISTFISLAFAITLAYKKLTDNHFYIPMLIISGAGMALTLINRFDFNIKAEYFLHCIGSLTFSIVTGITIFLLYFLSRKQNKINLIFCIITAIILSADAICLLIFKETGLIEVIPIFAGCLMLAITNLRRDKIEIKR